jgi:hypothetical protein
MPKRIAPIPSALRTFDAGTGAGVEAVGAGLSCAGVEGASVLLAVLAGAAGAVDLSEQALRMAIAPRRKIFRIVAFLFAFAFETRI